MTNLFISNQNKIIEVDQHYEWSANYVLENYPGKEQYGNPLVRMILDGWIKIDNDWVELRPNRASQFRNFLHTGRIDRQQIIHITFWEDTNLKYDKWLTVASIINEY